MKTKPWVATGLSNTPAAPAGLALRAPVYLTDQYGDEVGPIPLVLALLKALEFSKLGAEFIITADDGPILLQLRKGKVTGSEEMVASLQEMVEVSIPFFDRLYRQVQEEMKRRAEAGISDT